MTTAATQLETEEKLPWVGALWEPKGGAKHPSKGTVCGRERRLPGPARPLLPEGSEVPECPALTSFESLTFIFKGPSQRTQRDPSLPEGSGVTSNVSKLHSRSKPSSPAPFACHSGSPKRRRRRRRRGKVCDSGQGWSLAYRAWGQLWPLTTMKTQPESPRQQSDPRKASG